MECGAIQLMDKKIDLGRSEVLRDFAEFDPDEWSIVKHTPKWTVGADAVIGGGPDEPCHGQVFCRTPVCGDVLLEFDARIVPPSYHDIVWFWRTRFDAEPWSAGYLGCLGGWWSNCAGIEKLPNYDPSAIAPSHSVEPGRFYHIVSGSAQGDHFIAVDGRLVAFMRDSDCGGDDVPCHFGFGVYQSHVEFRNLRVLRPCVVPSVQEYLPATQAAHMV